MREALRRYLLQDPTRASMARDFLDDADDDVGDLRDALDEAYFEAARRLDPDLTRANTLLVRLVGDRTADGIADVGVSEKVIPALTAEVDAAAGTHAPLAHLGLVDLGRGSVVLHFRPKRPIVEPSSNEMDLPVASAADSAIRSVLLLHDLLESASDPQVIASRFGDNTRLLRAAKKLSATLDDLDLDLTARWWTIDGERVRSELTERGRAHAVRVFHAVEAPSRRELMEGVVTALDIDGDVTIKPDRGKKRVIHASADEVRQGMFRLGERVSAIVEVIEETDRVGLKGRPQRRFLGLVTPEAFPAGTDENGPPSV